jgi:hypothetical protein
MVAIDLQERLEGVLEGELLSEPLVVQEALAGDGQGAMHDPRHGERPLVRGPLDQIRAQDAARRAAVVLDLVSLRVESQLLARAGQVPFEQQAVILAERYLQSLEEEKR